MKAILKLVKPLLSAEVAVWFEEFKDSDIAVKYKITGEQVDGIRDWVLKKISKL